MYQQQSHQQHGENRRMFRGRGGANDRTNVPDKSKLLLRRKPKKYIHHHSNTTTSTNNTTAIDENNNIVVPIDTELINDDTNNVENVSENDSDEVERMSQQQQNRVDNTYDNIENEECIIEMKQLVTRIHNIRLSIQRASVATLSQPSIYESNVLFAIQKCVKIWSTIIQHYEFLSNLTPPQQQSQEEPDTTNNDTTIVILTLVTKVALQLFELIQLSVQCGPLHGCKPGYFKRCGYEICIMVQQYLQSIINYYPKTNITEEIISIQESPKVDGSEIKEGRIEINDETSNELCEWASINNYSTINNNECQNENNEGIDSSSDIVITNDVKKDDNYKNECTTESAVDNSADNNPKSKNVTSDVDSSDDNFSDHYRNDRRKIHATNDYDSNTDDESEDGEEDGEGGNENDMDDYFDDNNSAQDIFDPSNNNDNSRSIGTKNPRRWDELFFTSQQVSVINNWLQSCQKQTAKEKTQPPSRHIQKLQEEGCKNSARKKQLRQKKKDKQSKKYEQQK